MGLEICKNYKGCLMTYACIINRQSLKRENITYVTLSLFKDKQTREESLDNYLTNEVVTVTGVDYTLEQLYEEIKKPRYLKDIEGNVLKDENNLEIIDNGYIFADCKEI